MSDALCYGLQFPLSTQLTVPLCYCLFQQLAALLIARQVIGNLKESALPYILEQMRLAKLSFDLFGALSPTVENKTPPSCESEHIVGSSSEVGSKNGIQDEGRPSAGNRNVSQAELESSLYKVK